MAANTSVLIAATTALVLIGSPVLAGKTGVGGVGGFPVFIPPLSQSAPAGATLTTAAAVSAQMEAAVRFCARLTDKAYLVDCLAERIDAVARAMPSTGDLAEAKGRLLQASQELAALARANADPQLPRATARVRGGTSTRRSLTPVNAARRAAVQQQAAAVLERTETLLLRSPGRPATMEGYRQIASTVASGKVLLRST